ncbi:MAG TPA: choice-of-anchor Q domain-containing protein [Mycobacteriales bacterium]|nr:choice-of-anchor Q domain-containing protein [Mycobacteriales bacterium]
MIAAASTVVGITGILPAAAIMVVTVTTYTVTTTADPTPVANACVSVQPCSLREAVIAANANSPAKVVVPAGSYTLAIAPTGSDDATTGDLNITGGSVTISGVGATSSGTVIDGGGLDRVLTVAATANAVVSGVVIRHGSVSPTSKGGGVANYGSLALTSDVITANGAGSGGGIYNDSALTVMSSTVSGNTASGDGGGLDNAGASGSATITDSTITLNTAAIDGGGIANENQTTVMVSEISGNSAAYGGGLSEGYTGETGTSISLDLEESTISGNSAGTAGGGLDFMYQGGTLKHVTIATNLAPSGAGGGIGGASAPGLADTIVADNLGGNCHAAASDSGYNLDYNPSGSNTCSFSTTLHSIVESNPFPGGAHGGLADNGGPTATIDLTAASPAHDVVPSCSGSDQRGVALPGSCDMGAYQYNGLNLAAASVYAPAAVAFSGAVATFTDSDGNSGDTYTASIAWGDGSSSAGTVSGGRVTGSHSYAQPGGYTVTTTITDSDGSSITAVSHTSDYAPVYASNFNSGVDSHWTTTQPATFSSPATVAPGNGQTLLGPFNDNGGCPDGTAEPVLKLSNLPAHTSLRVSFAFDPLATWDGNSSAYGPDTFSVIDGSTTVMPSATFDNYDAAPQNYGFNNGTTQSYPHSHNGSNFQPGAMADAFDTLGANDSAYAGMDSSYRVTETVPDSSPSANLTFADGLSQNCSDERWAMGDVTVSVNAPATVTAVSGGGQSATVGASFANPLVAIVRDAGQNPIPGATVSLVPTPAASGATATFPSGSSAASGSDGTVSVPVTAGVAAGSYTVAASTSGASPASFALTNTAAAFTGPTPSVTGLSPTSGPTTGGTPVKITGSGFTGATSVVFADTPAKSFAVVSGSEIDAVSPAIGGAGPVYVTVTTPGGSSAAVPQAEFTYLAVAGCANLPPVRILDTRNGTGGLSAPLAAGNSYPIQVAGMGGVPSSATAVEMTVTAVGPAGAGNLRVYPDGSAAPLASTVNYVPHRTVANYAIVSLPSNGKVDLYSDGSASGALLDVVGYCTNAAGYQGQTPVRIIDTRDGTGGSSAKLAPGVPRVVTVAGVGGVPVGATAVALNVTAVGPAGAGNLRVYPDGSPTPDSSNINYIPGQDTAVFVLSQLPSSGKIDFLTSGSDTDLVVDVSGYYYSSTALVTQNPVRILDTRPAPDRVGLLSGPLPAGQVIGFQVSGVGGVPADARSVLLQVTAIDPSAGGGDLRVFPGDATTAPTASAINYDGTNDVADFVSVQLASNGMVNLYSDGSPVDVAVDVVGWVPASP